MTQLDARGRRLRAALAAVLVPDNTPELRFVREWLKQVVRPADWGRSAGPDGSPYLGTIWIWFLILS
jgi:hypothetical protein